MKAAKRKIWGGYAFLAAALVLALAMLFACSLETNQAFADTVKEPYIGKKYSDAKPMSCLKLVKGDQSLLDVYNATGKITWKSSNKKVATISSKGRVVGKKKGTCTISAKVGGKTYKCKLKVIEISKVKGITAKVTNKGNVKLTWKKASNATTYIVQWRNVKNAKWGESSWGDGVVVHKTSGIVKRNVSGWTLFKKGDTCDFRIRTVNDSAMGYGPWSDYVRIKITK